MSDSVNPLNKARWSEPLYECLDPSIRELVRLVRENGFDTHESCQGGPKHAYTSPTIIVRRFQDNTDEICKLL